jgi:hypothetical protein
MKCKQVNLDEYKKLVSSRPDAKSYDSEADCNECCTISGECCSTYDFCFLYGTMCVPNGNEFSREYCSELGHKVVKCCPETCLCDWFCGGGKWVAIAESCEGGKSCKGVGGPPAYCDETTEGQTARGFICHDCAQSNP